MLFVDFDLLKNLEFFALLLIWTYGACLFVIVMIL